MHRTNEANLSSITDNLEKLRESFGQWVNLSIESECKVIVTSAVKSIFKRGTHEIKLGELCENSSREVAQRIYSGKKIKARFVCALTIYGPNLKRVYSIGIVEGRISNKKIGNNGFGYDPIFIPKGKKVTFGQMKFKNKFKK